MQSSECASTAARRYKTMLDEADLAPRHWWALALRGVCAVMFGLLAFAWPGLTLGMLVLIFGMYTFADGVLAIVTALRAKGGHNWGLLLHGVLGILAGVAAFTYPYVSAVVLLYFVGGWAIATGSLQVLS